MSANVRYPRPPEIDAIRRARCAVVEASAGTGKTFILEHLVLDQVLAGVPIEQILVVTFTERATLDLRRRIRDKLSSVQSAGEGEADPGRGGSDGAWIIDERAKLRLQAARDGLDRASISTIHGFCQRVLSEHAFAHRRLFTQEIVGAGAAFSAAFRDCLRGNWAVSPVERPYLEAYLGANYRADSVDRLESLLFAAHRQVAMGAVVRPGFDEGRLRAAIAVFAGCKWDIDGWKAGFQQVGLGRSMSAIQKRLDFTRDHCLRVAGSSDNTAALPAYLLAMEIAEKKSGHFEYLRDRCSPVCGPGVPAQLLPLWEALRALDEFTVPLAAADVARWLPGVSEALEQDKRAAGIMDFDDMLRAVDLGLAGVGGDDLVASLRRRYRVALIDEFQDTDDKQWRIFRRLFLGRDEGTLLVVIGDPKQAIYGWRGADVHAYLRARNDILAQGGVAVSLVRNFRSTAAVVAATNAVFSAAGKESLFRGAIPYERGVECGRPELRAVDRDGHDYPALKLLSIVPERDGKLRAGELRGALLRRMATEIRALLDGGGGMVEAGVITPCSARDIFVLTRTIREGVEVGEALHAARIPYAYFKQEGLFRTEAADAIGDLLAAIDDPGDRSKRRRAYLTPFFTLRLGDLKTAGGSATEEFTLARLLAWKALADRGAYEDLFARVVDEGGLHRRQLFFGATERMVTNVRHIFEILLESASGASLGFGELVTLLAAFRSGSRLPGGEDPDVQRLQTDADAVQIMTMHKAKGLQAAFVFVYGGFHAASGFSSNIRTYHDGGTRVAQVGKPRDAALLESMKQEQREEDERLMYVALTRARATTFLPYFGSLERAETLLDDGTVMASEVVQRLTGAFGPINLRLRALLSDPGALADVDHEVVRVPCPDAAGTTAPWDELGAAAGVTSPRAAQMVDWNPADVDVEPGAAVAQRIRLERAAAVGPVVVSYSQLARMDRGGDDLAAPAPRAHEPAVVQILAEDDLPGGAATGILLHDLLERVPLSSFVAGESFETWCRRGEIIDYLDHQLAEEHARSRRRRTIERTVHGAFTTALPGEGGTRLPPLGLLPRQVLREAEILYPLPGTGSAAGFVRGFLDVLFEHAGLVYGLDWKSDRVGDGGGATDELRLHVERHYDLQIRLYTLGILRMLDVRNESAYRERFGGFHYVFLRVIAQAPAGSDAGVVLVRPAWGDVQRWQDELERDERINVLRRM